METNFNHKNGINKEIIGNYYDKYHSNNIIERFLVNMYRIVLKRTISKLRVSSIYEVGSGEGQIVKYVRELSDKTFIVGSDIEFNLLRSNKELEINIEWIVNSAYGLPIKPEFFDLVLACEVLEHLQDPELFLQNCILLKAKYYLFTIPNEPLWRMLNMLRLKYIGNFGNTPGHVNHWCKASFERLISQYFEIISSFYCQPWVFVLAKI